MDKEMTAGCSATQVLVVPQAMITLSKWRIMFSLISDQLKKNY
jgi:hypothetical protein